MEHSTLSCLPSRPRRTNCAGVTKEGEVRQLCSLEKSRRRFLLTRNCSRCLSDSGVNSVDMGMISPARIMIALRERSRQSSVYLETQLLLLDEVCEEVSIQHVLHVCTCGTISLVLQVCESHLLSPAFPTYSFPFRKTTARAVQPPETL